MMGAVAVVVVVDVDVEVAMRLLFVATVVFNCCPLDQTATD